MGSVTPAAGRGLELTVHVLEDDDAGSIREIIRAQEFTSAPEGWLLSGVTRTLPATFEVQKAAQMELDLRTDVSSFLIVDPKTRLESLPLLQLGAEIKRLRDSGSNIERLQTAWHMKLAYAGSVLVMALIRPGCGVLFSDRFSSSFPSGWWPHFVIMACSCCAPRPGKRGWCRRYWQPGRPMPSLRPSQADGCCAADPFIWVDCRQGAVMVWWITIGGFVLGCLIAYALIQGNSDEDKDS